MAAIHINNKYNNSKIASLYVRDNFETYKYWIDEGRLIYIDKKSELFPFTQTTIVVGGNNSQGKDTKNLTKTKKGLNIVEIEVLA